MGQAVGPGGSAGDGVSTGSRCATVAMVFSCTAAGPKMPPSGTMASACRFTCPCPSPVLMISRLTSSGVNSTLCLTTFPLRVGSAGIRFITPGRAVAIWLLEPLVRMVAMTLPPRAGRVCSSRPTSPFREVSRILRPVQSAVRPQPVR